MRRSNRLVILVGVLLAVLAFVGIVILLNRGPTGDQAPEEVTATVLVATEDIDLGEEITPAKVQTDEIDPAAVQGTALADRSAVSGERALFAIPEGSQVTAEAIGRGDQAIIDISGRLLAGEKAITFQVDRVTGTDFLVESGDHIDIVVTQDITPVQETADSVAARAADPTIPPRFEVVQGVGNSRTVKVILQNKRVVYVSATRAAPVTPTEEGQEQQPAPAVPETVVIIFAGTAQDAELIKFAQNDLGEIGRMTAVVRSTADDEQPQQPPPVAETTGITLDQLVDVYGLRLPATIEQLSEEAAAAQ